MRTGKALADGSSYRFSPTLGGFLAEVGGGGETASEGTDPGRCWRVRRATLTLLRAYARAGLSGRSMGDADALDRANRLLASYIRHVLGAELATMPLVFGSRLSR